MSRSIVLYPEDRIMFKFPFKKPQSVLDPLVCPNEIKYLAAVSRFLENNKVHPFFGYHYDNIEASKTLKNYLDIIGFGQERKGLDFVIETLLEKRNDKKYEIEGENFKVEYIEDGKKGPYSDSKITCEFHLTPIPDKIIEMLKTKPREVHLTLYD